MFDRNQRAWISKLAEGREPTTPAGHSEAELHPRPGDIVIAREVRHPSVRYTIALFGRQPQLSCGDRDKALKIARTYATRQQVDIWEQSGGRFTSVAPRGYGET